MSILGALLGLALAWGIKSLIVRDKTVDKIYPAVDYSDDDWASDSVLIDSVAVYDYCDSSVVAE